MKMPVTVRLLIGVALTGIGLPGQGAECSIARQQRFVPQGQTILHVQSGQSGRRLIVFSASLRVNTDGAPNSYHSTDLLGETRAINHICNAVSVTSAAGGPQLSCAQSVPLIRAWVRDGWQIPAGYRFHWENILAATTDPAGRRVPCVFRSGPYAGNFGSITSLRNQVSPQQAGECSLNDQIDQRFVPAVVLPSGDNPLHEFGAKIGDLVLVTNPVTGTSVAAVLADIGPPDNLGEGSVALNMRLLGITRQPRTHQDALQLDTAAIQMVVTVLPGTGDFQPVRPFSAENLAQRLQGWQKQNGFERPASLRDFALSCARQARAG